MGFQLGPPSAARPRPPAIEPHLLQLSPERKGRDNHCNCSSWGIAAPIAPIAPIATIATIAPIATIATIAVCSQLQRGTRLLLFFLGAKLLKQQKYYYV